MIFITARLNKGDIYIAEIEKLSKKLILKKTLIQKINFNSFSSEKAEEIASIISSSININKKVTKLSFCVDTAFAFLNLIPVDANLSVQDLNEHLIWEVSQYFPSKEVDNFTIRGYRFKNGEVDKVLIVAVERELISFLKAVADRLELKVQIIDIDHFSVENCLRERISSVRSRYLYSDFILVGLKRSRIDVSVFRRYEFKRYFYYVVDKESDMRYFLLKLINENVSAGFEKFIFYGEGLDAKLIDFISSMLGSEFYLLNPFESQLFLDVKVNLDAPYVFAPNIGLALRMLWSE